MKELINVIVPVHQSEAFLNRCLESIASQTYENIRVILVENGSTDNSRALCERWTKKDERFELLVLKDISGAGPARNAGLEQIEYSNGFLAFVDSDDYLHPTYLEYLYDLLRRNDADFSWCGVHNTFEKEKMDFDDLSEKDDEYLISGKKLLMREELRVMYSMVWGKLFKNGLWENVRFDPKYKYYEDGGTTFKVIYNADRVAISQRKLYNYFYSDNSSIRSSVSERKLRDGIETEIDKIKFYKKKNEPELTDMAYIAYLNTLLLCCRTVDGMENAGNLFREFFSEYKRYYKFAVNNKSLPKVQRLKYVVYRLFPHVQKYYIKLKMKTIGN